MTTTRPIVPRVNGESSVGVPDKHWGESYIDEGHFDSVKLNGGDLGEYLAESTGYGIVSGCEPTINNLTVTVGAGIVHLADGTRKELSASTVTLDAADSTNPRIDLVYIDSTGEVAKVTGTAEASPSVPDVPSGGINVCNATLAAGATTGTLIIDKQMITNMSGYGIYTDVEYGLTETNFASQLSNFLQEAEDRKCIAYITKAYNIKDNIIINNNTVHIEARVDCAFTGTGAIDFRRVPNLYAKNIYYSCDVHWVFYGNDKDKRGQRNIVLENCIRIGGGGINSRLYLNNPRPNAGYNDRTAFDYTRYGLEIANYAGYNALMITNKAIDANNNLVNGGMDNSAIGVTDRVTGVAAPAVLIDTNRDAMRVVNPNAGVYGSTTRPGSVFTISNAGHLAIGCTQLNSDSDIPGVATIKMKDNVPTIKMKDMQSGKIGEISVNGNGMHLSGLDGMELIKLHKMASTEAYTEIIQLSSHSVYALVMSADRKIVIYIISAWDQNVAMNEISIGSNIPSTSYITHSTDYTNLTVTVQGRKWSAYSLYKLL